MLRKTFIYVREVLPGGVLVMLTDWSAPIELPRELFTEDEFYKLGEVTRFTGNWNGTRVESKLILAGPFLIGE